MAENPLNNSNVQAQPTPQSNPQPQPRPVVNNTQTNTNYSNNTVNNIPNQYKPLSPWAYIGYNILFSIPIVGFIMVLVFAFDSSNNLNRRNYARSNLYLMLIVAIITLIIVGIIGALFGFAIFSTNTASVSSSLY